MYDESGDEMQLTPTHPDCKSRLKSVINSCITADFFIDKPENTIGEQTKMSYVY